MSEIDLIRQIEDLKRRLAIQETRETPSANFPIRATMWHDESTVTVGNAIVSAVIVGQYYNLYSFQNAPANGDEFTNNFFLAAGSYTLRILGATFNTYGSQSIYIDGVLQGTADWYTAGAVNNVVKSIAITVTANGRHTLRSVAGKNVASTNYFIPLTKMWIK